MYEKLFKRQEDICKIVANQKRLEIIQLLTHGALSVSAITSMLGISQSNLSQHLALLRQAGIVETRKKGTTVFYYLSSHKIAEACEIIRQFLLERDGAQSAGLLEKNPKSLYPLHQDVVCGMRLTVSEAAEHLKFNGETYMFCGRGCKDKFTAHPEQYIATAKTKEQ